MKSRVSLALAAAGLAGVCIAASNPDRWSVREQQTIQKTLTLSGPPMRLVVDNIDGYVHVTGTTGSQVRVVAHELIRAETDSDLQEAKNQVTLQVTEKPGTVSIYYDAPWRCNGEAKGCHGEQRRFYNVTFDIDAQVPRAARTVLSTVNNGDIALENTDGDFDIRNVNGGINMKGISGSGDANTVNGPLSVRFAKNPAGPSSFKSVNGQMDVYFRPALSADLLFKTFNGDIFSDFDVTPLPNASVETVRRDGKYVYSSRRGKAARVGQGGPEISFDAFNGSIRLHREQ